MCSECHVCGLPEDEHMLFLFFWRYNRLWYKTNRIGYTVPDGMTYGDWEKVPKRTTRTLVKHLERKGLIQARWVNQGCFSHWEYKLSDEHNELKEHELCVENPMHCIG